MLDHIFEKRHAKSKTRIRVLLAFADGCKLTVDVPGSIITRQHPGLFRNIYHFDGYDFSTVKLINQGLYKSIKRILFTLC